MTYNIFISHAWKYSDDYHQIVKWLDEGQAEGYFTWKNYSVPSHDPKIDPSTPTGRIQLEIALDNQIAPTSKVIILSGMYAAYSNWINYEIKTAKEKGKYIIGVKPWGQERTPEIISSNADVMIGWNKHSVIKAILGI